MWPLPWRCRARYAPGEVLRTGSGHAHGFSPALAAVVLLLFLCVAMVMTALCEPFTSSLVNKAHVACDFLVFFALLTGVLSTSSGKTWRGEADTMSIVVVGYAACLLAALVLILWLETGSVFHKGGHRHELRDGFNETDMAVTAKRVSSAVKRLSTNAFQRPSALASFSSTVAATPTPATSRSAQQEGTEFATPRAAAASTSALLTDPMQRTDVKGEQTAPVKRIQRALLLLAADPSLAYVDDDGNLKRQLQKCALKLEACMVPPEEGVQTLDDEYTASLRSMHRDMVSLAADAGLAEVDDGTNSKRQLEECTVKLETLMEQASSGAPFGGPAVCHVGVF
jgi:hypothetical protein